MLFPQDVKKSGAVFSADNKFRYKLWRIWDPTAQIIMFIGLNPSTANADTDDPTIRKVVSFAKKWGYGGVYMLNLFAYISTDPKKLINDYTYLPDKIGDDNDYHLQETAQVVTRVIFAWGAFEVGGRDDRVKEMFPYAMALKINKDGSPRHPLYVPGNIEPIYFTAPIDDQLPF